MRRPSWAILAAIALLAALPAARATGAAQASPSRIISLVPAVTETLFAIGAGPAVVGVSSFDQYPPEAQTRPSVGALVDPDFERILFLRPDLVIAYASQTDLLARLSRVRIPVFEYRHSSLADVTATIRQVGARVGRAAAADDLARQVERDLDRVRQAAATRPRRRTVLVFGREPGTLRSIYASGGIGFLHDLVELAGGIDVFADVRRENLQVSTETLLQRAPDVIVEVHPADGWTPSRIAQEQDVWRQLSSLPAVRTGRVQIIADDRLAIPGPRVAESARLIAEAIAR